MKYFFKNIFDFPRDFYRKCKRGYQRAYRGWADEDCWSFSSYLSNVIIDGLKCLKKNKHGYPICCQEDLDSPNLYYSRESEERNIKKWDEILDSIIWTFETSKKIVDNDWIYPYNNEYFTDKELNKWNLFCERMVKNGYDFKVMSKEEVDKYRLGWKLFQQYYHSLWD